MSSKNRKIIVTIIIALAALLLIVDRYYWVQISQWREDQATNIWLGYTAGFGNMPVGLISSKGIPNPNGMILLGSILSILPNLLSVSFFLGLVQMGLLILVGWKSFKGDWKYFLLATLPLLSSVILRSSSVEFWNQYTITLVNIFFLYWAVHHLEKPSLWNLPPIVVLILLAPSLYLAGITNAIVMSILTVVIFLYKRPKFKGILSVLIVILGILVISIFLTWYPYFQNVDLDQIIDYKKTRFGMVGTLQIFWNAFWGLPNYATFQWADHTTFNLIFKHAAPEILSPESNSLLKLMGRAYLVQAVFAFISLILMTIKALQKFPSAKDMDITVNIPTLRLVILSGLFIALSYGISSWLNGPVWMEGERPDQLVQFLPMFLLIVFLLPAVFITNGRMGKIVNWISYISLAGFSIVNIFCGVLIIRDHNQYRGDILTEADVPLIQKMQAIDFIVSDWKKHSTSDVIPVEYDLGGGVWDWVPEFGAGLLQWYPASMTEGRAFDYELVRRYGLTNQQEGVQLRSFGDARYLITYAFEDPPHANEAEISHHIFGRIRVSILDK